MKKISTILIIILFTISSCKKDKDLFLEGVWSVNRIIYDDGSPSYELGSDEVYYMIFKDMSSDDVLVSSGTFYTRQDIYSYNPTDTVITYSDQKNFTLDDSRIEFYSYDTDTEYYDIIELTNDDLKLKGLYTLELKKVYRVD